MANRTLFKAIISLILLEAHIHLAISTSTVLQNIRLTNKDDAGGQIPLHTRYHNENIKGKFNRSFEERGDAAQDRQVNSTSNARPASLQREMPNGQSNSHRYLQRHYDNPDSQTRSASNIQYSILQPFPLPAYSEIKNHGSFTNGRLLDTLRPYTYYQNYKLNSASKNNGAQQPLVYVNLQTTGNQNLPEKQNGQHFGHPPNQYIQVPKQVSGVNEASGSAAQQNSNQKQIPIEISEQETVDNTPGNKINFNYNGQRYGSDSNQQQLSLVQNPFHIQDKTPKRQGIKYYKIIISPKDTESILKHSYDPRELYETKYVKSNSENRFLNKPRAFQFPNIDSTVFPLSRTQQRTTSPSHLSLIGMENRQLIAIQKMMQPNKMRNSGMEELQRLEEAHKQLERMAQIQKVGGTGQEAGGAEKQEDKETEQISEMINQQMMELLTHLTRKITTQTEMKMKQQNPSAILYQPFVVMQRPDSPEMKNQQQPRNNRVEALMHKEKLMGMLLQQLSEIQAHDAMDLQSQRVIGSSGMQTQNVMELAAMKMKAAANQVPVKVEAVKQDLMQVIMQMLMEMKEQEGGNAAQVKMDLKMPAVAEKSQVKEETNEKQTTTDTKKEDMDMQMIQVMEMLLRNVIEMRKQKLNEQKVQMEMSFQKAMGAKAQDATNIQSQSTLSNEAPVRTEMPTQQTMEKMSQQDDDTKSPNLNNGNAMGEANVQSGNTKQEKSGGIFPESKDGVIGYRQVLIHIPNKLTKQPRIFVQANNEKTSTEINSLSSDSDKNSNVNTSSIVNNATTIPQNLKNPGDTVNSNLKQEPTPLFPMDYDYLTEDPSLFFSPYTTSSFHGDTSNPFFLESSPPPAFRSNLYSYDDVSLWEPDTGFLEDLPQLYKD